MARAAAIYDFTLTANGTFVLPVEGTYYRIRSATGSVQVKRDDGSMLQLEVGQGECNQLFKRLTIVDMSGAANSGTIIVADNNFVDERISGEVATINGGTVRTLANIAFYGGSQINGSPGLISHVQLWNPAGSGKLLCVESMTVGGGSAGHLTFVRHTVAASTLVRSPASKNTGSAASVSQIRTEQNAAILQTEVYFNNLGLSYANLLYQFANPIVVPPGHGIAAVNGSANNAIAAAFDFYERDE